MRNVFGPQTTMSRVANCEKCGGTGLAKDGEGEGPGWILGFAGLAVLLLIALAIAWDNHRDIEAWKASTKVELHRGCVQVEFSSDGKEWTPEDRPASPLPLMRLHNTCSGLAIRVDVQEAK